MSAYYNEIDPYAASWLENLIHAGLIAPGYVDRRSIRDVRPEDLFGFTQCHFFAGIGVWSYALRSAGWPDDRPVWTGSCPCQPFSAAGKRGGVADDRHLWPEWFRLISPCRPATAFGEQVASKDGLGWLDLVHADMEGAGYAVGAADLCAAGVGAPHIRQRLFFTARTLDHADNARRQVAGQYECGPSLLAARPEQSVGSGLVADAESVGLFGWEDDGDEGRRQRTSGQGRSADGLANAIGERGRSRQPRRQDATDAWQSSETDGVANGRRPRQTDGHWRNADWLFCRDGKWRPVVASHVEVVDGAASDMGYLCSDSGVEEKAQLNGNSDQNWTCQNVRSVRGSTGSEEVRGTVRGLHKIQPSAALRTDVHGSVHGGGDQGRERQEWPASVCKDCKTDVRSVRGVGTSPCASHRREPDEQCAGKFEDAVHFLSPSLALAELRRDRRTAAELRALLKAINQEGPVCDAFESAAEAWASLGEEAKNRLRVGFAHTFWLVRLSTPLIDGSVFKSKSGHPAFAGRSRAKLLQGYGNAIVAPLAAEFIKAVMECEP